MPALPPDRPGCPRRPARPQLPAAPRPLPDPAAVRLCLIPDSAPPYDAEVAAAGRDLATGPPERGPADQGPAERGPADQGPAGESRAEPAPPGARGVLVAAGPPGWPGQFAQVLAETLAGSRPPRQLVPWTTERARDRIQRLGPQLSGGQQPRIRRVVTCHPTADTLEMTVVVGFGNRVHALAVRLERADSRPAAGGRAGRPGRWLCTTVEAA
jgi:Family of unknown function (DUF6459)